MAVSFGIGSYIEGGVVTAVIIPNVVVDFFQEFQAEKAMDSVRSLTSPTTTSIRSTAAAPSLLEPRNLTRWSIVFWRLPLSAYLAAA